MLFAEHQHNRGLNPFKHSFDENATNRHKNPETGHPEAFRHNLTPFKDPVVAEWGPADEHEVGKALPGTHTIQSPYDGAVVGEVPAQTAADVDAAVRRAHEAVARHALPAWRRAEILTAASNIIDRRREELAQIITKESAKPITTARVEVARALSTMGLSGIEARKLGGAVLPMEGSMVGEGKLAFTTRVPCGVVGAISPFNFPLNLVAHKVGPAIAAGCPVVLKPASQTPLSALALRDVLIEAGLPESWLNVVTGSGGEVGNAIVDHPGIAAISFTGSSDVGWAIQGRAPRKRVGLELGNSTPIIIEADSDWEEAAYGIAAAGFNHAGQSCISVQRVYVQRDIAEPFTDLLVDLVSKLETGSPYDDATNVSSLISEHDRDRVHSWIGEAVAQGAHVRCGGEIDGTLLSPAVLTDTTLDMKVCSEEVFGPVVALQTYGPLDEAIRLANGTRYGLQAGIYTKDIDSALIASQQLEFGGVLVNEVPTWRADLMPYGGVKDSGNTREGPAYAIEHFTDMRLIAVNLG
jgi:acyl-CoA reductase-like NAD-dependent aldehyde dehydrogenase